MLVTLKVLESKKVSEWEIEYFKSLEKQEWEVIELMKRCFKDGKCYFAEWLFQCVETVEELGKAIDLTIKNEGYLGGVFSNCKELFEKNQELFKKAVEYHIEKGECLHYAFEYCNDCNKAFENDPELHKKALEHQKKYCHKA